jgi:5'-3' exonuclease
MIASIMVQMGKSGGTIEIPMFKHMVLNSLRSYRQKFSSKYGELVIACDTGNSWRKATFPYYKASRKKDRDESPLDWESIFNGLREIRSDLRNFFPYKVIEVDGAEADDIIGTLCHEFGSYLPGIEPILVVSGDKDFKQLQVYLNVDQFDPVNSKKVVESNPESFLLEHIIKGDRGDGVPNILSPDNCLVLSERQGVMSKKRLESFIQQSKSIWTDSTAERNFKRNQQMIDLSYTPNSLKVEILDQFNSQSSGDRSKIFNYMIHNKMKHLMEFINEF